MGVGFDSSDMSWFLSESKANKVKKRCLDAARSQHLDLKQVQKLMGSVNDLAQMCPLLKFHKREGNVLLTRFGGNENILLVVPQKLKEDLLVIAKVAESTKKGLPIADQVAMPTLAALTFYTDAAGASFTMCGGKRFFHDNAGRGVACVAGTSLEDMWGWTRISWPETLLQQAKDEKGRFFGCKSTTLESVGLLLPLIAFPDRVAGKNIVFKIDNIAVMYGWGSGYVKNDSTASEILRCAQYLAGFLGTTIFVDHVGRMSDDLAGLADELSRKETSTKENGARALSYAEFRRVDSVLLNWLENPCGKNLCRDLLCEMERRFPYH